METLALLGPIGPFELVLIVVALLLVFGPKALPQLGRSLGEGIRGFRDATKAPAPEESDPAEDVTRPRGSLPPPPADQQQSAARSSTPAQPRS